MTLSWVQLRMVSELDSFARLLLLVESLIFLVGYLAQSWSCGNMLRQ